MNKILTTTIKYDNGSDRNTLENGGIIEDTDAAAFETMNGESIALYYNPNCKQISQALVNRHAQSEVCINMIYDLNGTKSPNEVGKDIGFITVFSSTDPVVAAPVPVSPILPLADATRNMYSKDGDDAISFCKNQSSESRLPDMYEGYSMFVNANLLGVSVGNLGDFWTGTPAKGVGTSASSITICPHAGQYYTRNNSNPGGEIHVRCIEK